MREDRFVLVMPKAMVGHVVGMYFHFVLGKFENKGDVCFLFGEESNFNIVVKLYLTSGEKILV